MMREVISTAMRRLPAREARRAAGEHAEFDGVERPARFRCTVHWQCIAQSGTQLLQEQPGSSSRSSRGRRRTPSHTQRVQQGSSQPWSWLPIEHRLNACSTWERALFLAERQTHAPACMTDTHTEGRSVQAGWLPPPLLLAAPHPKTRTTWLAQQRKGIVQEAQGGLQLCAIAQVESGSAVEQQVEGQHEQDAGQPLCPLPRLRTGGVRATL